MPYKGLAPLAGLSAYQLGVSRVEAPMWPIMTAEFVATGALLMFWFQALSAGKICWPNDCVVVAPAANIARNAARVNWREFVFGAPSRARRCTGVNAAARLRAAFLHVIFITS